MAMPILQHGSFSSSHELASLRGNHIEGRKKRRPVSLGVAKFALVPL